MTYTIKLTASVDAVDDADAHRIADVLATRLVASDGSFNANDKLYFVEHKVVG